MTCDISTLLRYDITTLLLHDGMIFIILCQINLEFLCELIVLRKVSLS